MDFFMIYSSSEFLVNDSRTAIFLWSAMMYQSGKRYYSREIKIIKN